MKKIILYTALVILIPFVIISLFNNSKPEKEIELKYVDNLVVRVKKLKTNTIEVIPLEEYVVGVLAGEVPTTFNLEAIKAQAVASRSYVLKRMEYNKDKEYDVVDSTLNQVFLDNNYLKERWGNDYTTKINKLKTAVNETLNEYLEYDGKVVDAMFFSTSNGYTESSNLVFGFEAAYLKSVESTWDQNVSPVFNATKDMSLQEFYDKLGLPYQETITLEILKKSDTNRILEIKINGQVFSGKTVYEKLKIRSTDFNITQNGSNLIINTKGYGHGVGMSQYGAEGMAIAGYKYDEILKYYYSNVTLKKINN